MTDPRRRTTELLSRFSRGKLEPGSAEELLELTYDELHRLAAGFMVREQREHTLQATALVNEAYVKLVDFSPANGRIRRDSDSPHLANEHADACP